MTTSDKTGFIQFHMNTIPKPCTTHIQNQASEYNFEHIAPYVDNRLFRPTVSYKHVLHPSVNNTEAHCCLYQFNVKTLSELACEMQSNQDHLQVTKRDTMNFLLVTYTLTSTIFMLCKIVDVKQLKKAIAQESCLIKRVVRADIHRYQCFASAASSF